MFCSDFHSLLVIGFLALATTGALAETAVITDALVTPEVRIELASPTEGIVEEILGKEGGAVEANGPILRLRSAEDVIRLRHSKLVESRSTEDSLVMKRLFEENAASRDDFRRADIQARQATAERELLELRLEDRTIRSPVVGVVLRIFKSPGEAVQRLERVAEVVALRGKHLIGFLDAKWIGRIAPGGKVRVFRAEGSEPVSGEIDVVDPVLDAGGQVFRVKMRVDDPDQVFAAGTRVRVEIPVE